MEEYFRASRQSERMRVNALELALLFLRIDPTSCPLLEAVSISTALCSLHKCAISTIRCIFAQYEAQRKGIIVELLSQLCQSFAVKTPYKSYPLHHSTHLSGDSSKYTSMNFVALLSCLQSVVNVKESLVKEEQPKKRYKDRDGSAKKEKKKGKQALTQVPNDNELDKVAEETIEMLSATQVDASKKCVTENYRYCTIFITELFQVI
jgi:hypothetical protein